MQTILNDGTNGCCPPCSFSAAAGQSTLDGAQLENDPQVYQDCQDQGRCDEEDHQEIPIYYSE